MKPAIDIEACIRAKFPADLPEDFFLELLDSGKAISLRKGDYLIREGDSVSSTYIILKGSFLRNVCTSEGEMKTIMFHTSSFEYFMTCVDGYLEPKQKTIYFLEAN